MPYRGDPEAKTPRRRRPRGAAIFGGICGAWLAAIFLLAGPSSAQDAGDGPQAPGSGGEVSPDPGADSEDPGAAPADAARPDREAEARGTRTARDRRRRAPRTASRKAVPPISGPAARTMLRRSFPEALAALRSDPLIPSGRVDRYTSDYSAIVRLPGDSRAEGKDGEEAQPTALVESTLPLRARNEAGAKRPIDLALEVAGAGFEPKTALVPVRLPASAAAAATFPELGITARYRGASSQAGAVPVGDEGVIYPNAAVDTDLLWAPIHSGLETFWQVRSPSAPERFELALGLPRGTELVATAGGTAEIRRDGERIGYVPAPTTVDQEGNDVPTRMRVAGDRLVVTVTHRKAGSAYPLLVDPAIEVYNWSAGNSTALGDWGQFESPTTANFQLHTSCNTTNWGCYGNPANDHGLYIYARAAAQSSDYAPGDTAIHYYRVAGWPNTTAHITRADYSKVQHRKRGSNQPNPRIRLGLWDLNTNGYLAGAAFQTTDELTNFSRTVSAPIGADTADQAHFEVRVPPTAPAFTLNARRESYVGGAVLYLVDEEDPTWDLVNTGLPPDATDINSPVYHERIQATHTATASDPGLGIQRIQILRFANNILADLQSRQPSPPCSGTKRAPCPSSFGPIEYGYDTNAFPEGLHQVLMRVEDAGGRATPVAYDRFYLRIDRTAPILSAVGPLRDPNVDGDELAVEAIDRNPDGTGAAVRNVAGLERVEIFVDGKLAHSVENPNPPATRNQWDASFSWSPDPFETFTRRPEIEVVATDYLGHETRESWTVGPNDLDIGNQDPEVERFTGEGVNEWTNEVGEREVAVNARDRRRDLQESDRGVEAIRLAVPGSEWDTHTFACGGPEGCQSYRGHTFDYSTEDLEDGVTTAAARARAPDGNVSKLKTFDLKIDRVAPAITEFTAAPALADGEDVTAWDITISATDEPTAEELTSGVRRLEFWAAGERRRVFTQPCDEGSCAFSRTFRYRPARESIDGAALPEARAVAVDGAGNVTEDDEPDVEPIGVATGITTPESRHGLEQYFHYDSQETGLSGAHTNLANGNAVWHKVPIVNPGRGLSSVVNLTYNAHDFPLNGLLDLNLGAAGDETKARLSNLLAGLGVGYDEAGPGFSLGISGLSRLNEPLGGFYTAQLGQTPVIDTTPEAVYLTDPDGTQHRFTPKPDAPTEFDPPPGVDLRLRAHSLTIHPHPGEPELFIPQNWAKLWAFTRPDGVTYFYDGFGFARSIEDRNGNEIRFDYELVNPLTLEPCPEVDVNGNPAKLVVAGVCEPRLAEVVDPAGVEPGPDDGDSERILAVSYWAPGEGQDFAVGKVKSITDHEGRELRFTYAGAPAGSLGAGRLAQITEAHGTPQARTTSFQYDALDPLGSILDLDLELGHPQITGITDPRGNTTQIAYEEGPDALLGTINQLLGADLGSLNSLLDALPDRRVEAVTSRNGNRRDYAYEPVGSTENTATVTTARPTSDPDDSAGARTQYQYELDHADRLAAITDPLSRRTELDWSQDNRVNRLTEAVGTEHEATTLYSYNENGALLSLTDPLSRQTTLTYRDGAGGPDLRAQLVADDDSDAFVSDLTSIRRPNGSTWTYGLDETEAAGRTGLSDGEPRGNVTSETDPLSNTTTHAYDEFGQVSETINAEGERTEFRSYDENGLSSEIISPRGTAEQDPLSHRFLYLYDGAGNLIQAVDPRGADDPGVPQTQPLDEPLDPSHPYTTTLTYDPLDRLTVERTPKCSNAGDCGAVAFSERSYAYDANDNLTETTDATGAVFETEYTRMDRPEEERRPAADGQGGSRTETQAYAYDPEESLVRITAPRAAEPGTTREHVARFVLDDAGRRLATVRQGTSAADDLITSYAYDARDNVVGTALPRDNSTREETDGVPAYTSVPVEDAVANAADPAHQRAAMEYDAADQLTAQVEDPANPDPDGPEGPEEPEPGLELRSEFSYDANGNVVREVSPRGFSDGADTANHSTFYDYDPRDLLVATTDPVGSRASMSYDAVGRLTAEERPNGFVTDLAGDYTVNYSYNANGELASRTIPLAEGQYGKDEEAEMDDLAVSYERDPVGNPVEVTDARDHAFQNTFFDSGQLASTERPSWWQADWGPARAAADPARRFRAQASGAVADTMVPVGGPVISEADSTGRATGGIGAEQQAPGMTPGDFGEVEAEGLPSLVPRAGLTTLRYDDELRLTRVTDVAGHDRRIAYDPQGRITQKQLPFEPGDPIVHAFTYDRNGNLAASTDGEGEVTSFSYDAFDRLRSEDAPGSLSRRDDPDGPDREVTAYRYDPNSSLERRLTPRFDAGERLTFDFRYDPVDRLTSEQNPAAEAYAYTYDPASNVASETTPRGNRTDFFHDTAQRLTRMVEAADSDVARATTFSYDPNGNRTLVTAPGATSREAGAIDRTTCTIHDGSDRPWKQTVGFATVGQGDGATRTTITEHDAQGNLRRVVNPPGVEGHCFAAAAQVADPDPQGQDALLPGESGEDVARDATVAHYDEDGLLRRRYLPWGDNAPGTDEGAIDANGVDQQAENQTRYVQRFTYAQGSPGWLQTVTEPHEVGDQSEVYATSYAHHPSGWFRSATDPDILRPGEDEISGRVVTYTYEKRGLQTRWETLGFDRQEEGEQVPPDERKVRRSFYPSGLLKQRTGVVTGTEDTEKRRYEYYYNQNRSLHEVFDRLPDNIAGTPLDPGFTERPIVVDRDRAEREVVVDERWQGSRDTRYRYDEDGNLTVRRVDGQWDRQSESYSGGRRTDFDYDELSRETRMEVDDQPADPESPVRTWETSYHPSGEIDVLEKPNGTQETHTFRADGLIESIRRETQGSDPDDDKDQTYSYDGNGNRTADERGTYAYNARSQLVLWDPKGSGQGNEPTSYVMNGSGQIAEERSADLDTAFDYAGHRLLTRTVTPEGGSAQVYRYRYDDFGNTTRIVGPGAGSGGAPPDLLGLCNTRSNWGDPDTAYFCWDEFSRLLASQGSAGDGATTSIYLHDGLDRRDIRINSGDQAPDIFIREYFYAGLTDQLTLEKRDFDEGKNAHYDYNASGRRLGQTTQGSGSTSRRYYATDAQGSVEALESPQGEIAADETYAYDPYGALDQEGDVTADPEDDLSDRAQANPYRFQGHYYDAGIKSYDMKARQYAPEEGRFLSQDVFASAGADLQLQTDPLTQNRYVFAGGNPVSRVEWDGHKAYCPYKSDRKVAACLQTVGEAKGATPGEIASATADVLGSPASSSSDLTGLREKTRDLALNLAVPGQKPLSEYPESHPTRTQTEEYIENANREELEALTENYLIAANTDWGGGLHDALAGCGLVPVFGAVCDAADAIAYAAEGNPALAGLSLLGVLSLPGADQASGAARLNRAAAGRGARAGSVGGRAVGPTQARGGAYVLRDPVTGEVVRTGRSKDLLRRQAEHARDPALKDYRFEAAYRTNSYAEQRGLEQVLHNTYQPGLNRTNPISIRNPKGERYLEAAHGFLQRYGPGP